MRRRMSCSRDTFRILSGKRLRMCDLRWAWWGLAASRSAWRLANLRFASASFSVRKNVMDNEGMEASRYVNYLLVNIHRIVWEGQCVRRRLITSLQSHKNVRCTVYFSTFQKRDVCNYMRTFYHCKKMSSQGAIVIIFSRRWHTTIGNVFLTKSHVHTK